MFAWYDWNVEPIEPMLHHRSTIGCNYDAMTCLGHVT